MKSLTKVKQSIYKCGNCGKAVPGKPKAYGDTLVVGVCSKCDSQIPCVVGAAENIISLMHQNDHMDNVADELEKLLKNVSKKNLKKTKERANNFLSYIDLEKYQEIINEAISVSNDLATYNFNCDCVNDFCEIVECVRDEMEDVCETVPGEENSISAIREILQNKIDVIRGAVEEARGPYY